MYKTQGEINKTVSEMKQTNESFTKSIESLAKKMVKSLKN